MSQPAIYLDRVRKQIHESPLKQYAEIVEEKSGINAEYFAFAAVIIAISCLLLGIGSGLICHIIGIGYPFYATIRSIENSHSEKTQWLIYWVVYGLFGCIEVFIDFFLYWNPIYYPMKIVFLVWCMHPQGATHLYEMFIKDFFKAHEDKIDAALSKVNASGVAEAAASVASSVASAAKEVHESIHTKTS